MTLSTNAFPVRVPAGHAVRGGGISAAIADGCVDFDSNSVGGAEIAVGVAVEVCSTAGRDAGCRSSARQPATTDRPTASKHAAKPTRAIR
jgi:hypothetical protein